MYMGINERKSAPTFKLLDKTLLYQKNYVFGLHNYILGENDLYFTFLFDLGNNKTYSHACLTL